MILLDKKSNTLESHTVKKVYFLIQQCYRDNTACSFQQQFWNVKSSSIHFEINVVLDMSACKCITVNIFKDEHWYIHP